MSPIEITDLNGPIIALLGVLATIITNYVIQRRKADTDAYSVDRNTLSKDQLEFRKAILEELNECRETCDKLRVENDLLHKKALDDQSDKHKLALEIIELQREIVDLKATIDSIMNKVKPNNI